MSLNTCYKIVRTGNGFKERIHIKAFKTAYELHKFLATSDNGLFWHDCTDTQYEGLKRGIYARAGGSLHNVKNLDSSVLAHI